MVVADEADVDEDESFRAIIKMQAEKPDMTWADVKGPNEAMAFAL